MPIYQFKCKCGKEVEKIVKIGTKEIKCPVCNGTADKIISPSSFIINGYSYKNHYGLKKDN